MDVVGFKAVAIHGAKKIVNFVKSGANKIVKLKRAAVTIANGDAKIAKQCAKNPINALVHVRLVHNAEAARTDAKIAKVDVKKIANVAKVMSAITVKLAKRHANRAVNRLVKQVVKHRANQVAKRAHRQTRHRQHRQQLQFRRKLRAATR